MATARDDGDAAAASGAGAGRRLRVFFLPSFARGHLIPQTDLACLMAAARPGEVEATMVVTPANAALIAPTVARAAAAGHAVRVLRHPFPEVGLGDGVECLATAPARDAWRVYRAMELVQTSHEATSRCSGSTAPTPSCPTCRSGGPPWSPPSSACRASRSTPSASSRSSP